MMEGVRFNKEANCSIIYIDSLSDELKDVIRSQLCGIFHGLAHVEELPEVFTLANTLRSFVQRYQDKDENTKKGMIGELLAHIVINNFHSNLTSLSILKNKEDRSIKKGFDIIYFDPSTIKLWFSEVKSGSSENIEDSASDTNKILLNRSKSSIRELFSSERQVLWESALIDVQLTLSPSQKRIDISRLLGAEINVLSRSNHKHVILVSALYRDLNDEIGIQSLIEYYNGLISENIFNDALIISIQKRTYEAVAQFIINESNHDE